MDVSVLAARALRTMNLRQVPQPDMPLQVFGRREEERRARLLMAAIGDPKIPVLGNIRNDWLTIQLTSQRSDFVSEKDTESLTPRDCPQRRSSGWVGRQLRLLDQHKCGLYECFGHS